MSVYFEGSLTSSEDVFEVSIESFIIYHLGIHCDSNVTLNVVVKNTIENPSIQISNFNKIVNIVQDDREVPEITNCCRWPVVITGNKIVAGLCAVSRQICQIGGNKYLKKLLGFKESCLMACSETSSWTKFCEVDIINETKSFLINPEMYVEGDLFNLPNCWSKFEYHMREPVRMHNIYKIAREILKDKDLKSSLPIEQLNLNHFYAEGLYMTLADFIIYCCYKVILAKINLSEDCKKDLPLITSWIERMDLSNVHIKIEESENKISINKINFANIIYESLYSSDPNKTKQDINVSNLAVEQLTNNLKDIEIINDFLPYGHEIEFDWTSISYYANPSNGALPKKRSKRKCQQLESVAKAVMKIAQDKSYRIVDFCSGGGHLGILIATLLPNCKIVLVENKERSLRMALERILKLELKNVVVVQCNLNYFIGNFDIGISLHACGVATDLVIQKSIDSKAHFVCCPCCYGSIKNCHQVVYPRSVKFKETLSYDEYLRATHGADQTHDNENPKTKNGFYCMNIVDTDRKLYAEKFGYKMYLGKLQPACCTPKNNLLVGILE